MFVRVPLRLCSWAVLDGVGLVEPHASITKILSIQILHQKLKWSTYTPILYF